VEKDSADLVKREAKGGWNMSIKVGITTGLAAFGLLLAAGAALAADFDTAMEPILAEYLAIQEALAADTIEGVEEAVLKIQVAAKDLHPGHAAGEHAVHYENIPQDLLAACEKLRAGGDIGSIREAFKELSKPVSMWVTMAKPKHTSVMYCPMEKAGWVQRGSEVANPYMGETMASCGEKVGGSEH
jgi:Cu(I)/Ag(I) efflux system membrane fusion protein